MKNMILRKKLLDQVGNGTTALAPALILITVIRNTVTSLKVVYLIGDTILMI